MVVGFAGAGSMARAMARGLARGPDAPSMRFCDLDADRAAEVAGEVAGEVSPDLPALAGASDIVVLAVKPAALADVAPELAGAETVLSVLAATPLERLARELDASTIVRAMPSQPAQVGAGVSCYVVGAGASEAAAAHCVSLLERLGPAVAVAEEQIDAAMAVMSCAPAYVAELARALTEAGAKNGLPAELATRLVVETVAGTGALLREREASELKRAVAPPGGATEAGLEALERGGFAEALAAAVEASLERFR